jgi:nicotinate-nucleotide adenylyltransferase
VSDIELRRAGMSYTIDTVCELAAALPSGTEILLLIGTDAARDLPSWRDVAGVFRLARPVVVERPGDERLDWDALSAALPDGLGETLRASVLRLETARRVSSTRIRARLARGESVAGLVPPPVAQYIESHGLYRG